MICAVRHAQVKPNLIRRKVQEVAEASGLTRAYVSQIEAGSRVGTVDVLKRITEALGVELDDLA